MPASFPFIPVQTLAFDAAEKRNITLRILRLDTVHPVISGNKLFKLHYFLQQVTNNTLVTFGGAYSNHLAATAFACHEKNIRSIGIVRGEKPPVLSHTLLHCIQYGMELHFVSRDQYRTKDEPQFLAAVEEQYGKCTIVPEGGYAPVGAAGAAHIMEYIGNSVTHICTAAGTATTAAGLLTKLREHQQLIIVPVLKGLNDMMQRISYLSGKPFDAAKTNIQNEYHFGGYAKQTPELVAFMNKMYDQHELPLDFVYTAKMMYAVYDLIEKDCFPCNSDICCIHTGGLQGNRSLPANTLTF